MDRGGDRGYLYQYLLHENLRFTIRLRSDRMVIADVKESVMEVAKGCRMLFHEYIAKESGSEEKPLRLEVGYRRVRLPDRNDEFGLVVVKEFGPEPMMLLTNPRLRRSGSASGISSRLI